MESKEAAAMEQGEAGLEPRDRAPSSSITSTPTRGSSGLSQDSGEIVQT